MRRLAVDRQRHNAHHPGRAGLELVDLGPRHLRERHDAGPEAALGQELSEDRAGGLVDEAAASDAQDRALLTPGGRYLSDVLARFRHDVAVGHLRDEAGDGGADIRLLVGGQDAAYGIAGGEFEALQHDVVVIAQQRAFLQQQLGMLLRLFRVVGEDSLVEILHRRQRWPVAKQHFEEFELVDVAAEHHEADRQRRGEKQPDRSPQPCPEQGRDQNRERRHPGRLPVEHRLDEVADDGFEDEEQDQRRDGHRPTGIDRCGQGQREYGRNDGADIGNEPHQGGQDAPEDRVGDADEVEPDADHEAEGRVERQLDHEVAAQAPGGVVHRHRGAVQVVGASEADHPVAQVLPLHQQEQEHDKDDADGRKRMEHWREQRAREFDRARRALAHLHQHRLLGRGLCGRRRLVLRFLLAPVALAHGSADIGDVGGHPPGRTVAQTIDLAFDRGAVAWHVVGEVGELDPNEGRQGRGEAEGEQHRGRNREETAEPQLPQQVHQRAKHEGQEDRDGDRDQHVAREVEARGEDRGDDEGRCEHRGRRLGGRDTGSSQRRQRRLRVRFRGHAGSV